MMKEWVDMRPRTGRNSYAGLVTLDLEAVDGGTIPAVILPEGATIEGVKELFDEYLPFPERATGFATVTDTASFIAMVNRQKVDDTVIFANDRRDTPALKAVYDYHAPQTAGRAGQPRHLGHGVHYALPLSDEWKAWAGFEKRGYVAPAEFAEFVEDRIADVIDVKESDALSQLRQLIGGSWASPSKLIELSRGIQINTSEVFQSAQSLSSGEVSLRYEVKHGGTGVSSLTVPNLFAIGIPVFHNDGRYQIAIRLRYRVREGKITWAIAPYRIDQVFDVAFTELVKTVADSTALPIFHGAPEK
jgi:uncharacterized protein YfdQ (DUF2303 family)